MSGLLDSVVRRARRRETINAVLRQSGRGLLAGAAAALLMLLLDRGLDLDLRPTLIGLALASIGAAAGAALALLRAPPPLAIAVRIDRSMRLSDRLGTARALAEAAAPRRRGQDAGFTALARADAERAARGVDVRRLTPIRLPRTWAGGLVLLAALWLGTLYLPSLTREARGARDAAPPGPSPEAIEADRRALEQAIDESLAEVAKDPSVRATVEEDLAALERLASQLAEGGAGDVQAERDETAARLSAVADELAEQSRRELEAAEEVARRFSALQQQDDSSAARDLTEALRRGELEQAAALLEQLARSDDLSETERRAAADALRDLGRQLDDAGRDRQGLTDDERDAMARTLADQHLDDETIDELLDGSADPDEMERLLRNEQIAEEVARQLSRDLDRLRERRAINDEAEAETERLAEALRDAADRLDEGPRPPATETPEPPESRPPPASPDRPRDDAAPDPAPDGAPAPARDRAPRRTARMARRTKPPTVRTIAPIRLAPIRHVSRTSRRPASHDSPMTPRRPTTEARSSSRSSVSRRRTAQRRPTTARRARRPGPSSPSHDPAPRASRGRGRHRTPSTSAAPSSATRPPSSRRRAPGSAGRPRRRPTARSSARCRCSSPTELDSARGSSSSRTAPSRRRRPATSSRRGNRISSPSQRLRRRRTRRRAALASRRRRPTLPTASSRRPPSSPTPRSCCGRWPSTPTPRSCCERWPSDGAAPSSAATSASGCSIAARRLADTLPEAQRRRWAERMPQGSGSPGEGTRGPDAGPTDPAGGAPPVDVTYDDVDLRGEAEPDAVIAEWLSKEPIEGAPAVDRLGRQGRARAAQRVAERAVSEASVPSRYHELIDRYFGRIEQTIAEAAGERGTSAGSGDDP